MVGATKWYALVVVASLVGGCAVPSSGWRKTREYFKAEETQQIHVGHRLSVDVWSEMNGDYIVEQHATALCVDEDVGHMVILERRSRMTNPLWWLVLLGSAVSYLALFEEDLMDDDYWLLYMMGSVVGSGVSMYMLITPPGGQSRERQGSEHRRRRDFAKGCGAAATVYPVEYAPSVQLTYKTPQGVVTTTSQVHRGTATFRGVGRYAQILRRYCTNTSVEITPSLKRLNTSDPAQGRYFEIDRQNGTKRNSFARTTGAGALTDLPSGELRRMAQRCLDTHLSQCAPSIRQKHSSPCEAQCLHDSFTGLCAQEFADCQEFGGSKEGCTIKMNECLELFDYSRAELTSCTKSCVDVEVEKGCAL